jgi:hypothetical protein
VLLYIEDPIMTNMGNQPLHAAYGWQDPASLASQIVGDLAQGSHGIVHYNIVQTVVSRQFPVMTDGFQYTPTTWSSDWANRTPHNCSTSSLDYNRFITDNNIVSQINSGAFDEVWVYSDPMGCMSESTMAGDGAYYVNSSPVPNVNSPKAFVIMGWNYERGVGEAIHSYGHRVENIMCHMYNITGGCYPLPQNQNNNWSKFVTVDYQSSGNGGVGTVHCPVNGLSCNDSTQFVYDYNDSRYVVSNADDWYNYPNFTGQTRYVNRNDWSPNNADPQREYLDWWYSHIPHFPARGPDGLLNDWWHYIINADQYKYGDLPPHTSITSGPSGTVSSTSATFTFSSSEPESTFTCSLDGSASTACPSPYTLTGLGQGSHTLLVAAIDHAGNVDPSPASATWTVNTTPTTVSVTNPGNQTTYTSAQLKLQMHGSSSGGGPLTWSATGLPGGLSISSSTGQITGQITGTSAFNVTVTAKDQTGATGKATFIWSVKPDVGTAISGNGGLCLDDWQSTITSGNPIDAWVCNGTGAQKWTLSSSKLKVLGQCLTDPRSPLCQPEVRHPPVQ